ncbi:hypothetical protein D3C78_741040 [compost metagenome]
MVEGRQQVVGSDAAGVAADRLPVGRVGPALVDALQRLAPGGRLAGQRQLARGLRQQAAVAGQLHVQALGQIAQALLLAGLRQFFAERLIDRLRRQAATVPGVDRRDRARQGADHLGVVDAAPEQRTDRHQEGQQQECQQRQDQRLRLQAIHPLGARQALLEVRAGGADRGQCEGHGQLRESGGKLPLAQPQPRGRRDAASAPLPEPRRFGRGDLHGHPYLAAQALKRCSSCSP